VSLGSLCAWLAPALDVDLFAEDAGESQRVVSAFDWLTLDEVGLFARLSLAPFKVEKQYGGSLLSEVRSSGGELLGRGAFLSSALFLKKPSYFSLLNFNSEAGVVTLGGLRAGSLGDHYGIRGSSVVGIFLGKSSRASRDFAAPLANRKAIAIWASDQAERAYATLGDPGYLMKYAEAVIDFGGDPGRLPVAEMDGAFLDRKAIEDWQELPFRVLLFWGDGCLSKSDIPRYGGPSCVLRLESKGIVYFVEELLARRWGCSVSEIIEEPFASEYCRYDESDGLILKKPKLGPS
jgi:hypothetical protein